MMVELSNVVISSFPPSSLFSIKKVLDCPFFYKKFSPYSFDLIFFLIPFIKSCLFSI